MSFRIRWRNGLGARVAFVATMGLVAAGITGCGTTQMSAEELASASASPASSPPPPAAAAAAAADSKPAPKSLGKGALSVVNADSWMGALFAQKPDVRLRDMIIPGSHDSGTFAITCKSDLTIPINELITKDAFLTSMALIGLGPLYPELLGLIDSVIAVATGALWVAKGQGYCPIQSMAKAQGGNPNDAGTKEDSGNFLAQLNSGVRFFDIRVYEENPTSDSPDGANFLLSHGSMLTEATLNSQLDGLLYWLQSHPKEFVGITFHSVASFQKPPPKSGSSAQPVNWDSLRGALTNRVYNSWFSDRGVKGLCDVAIKKSDTGGKAGLMSRTLNDVWKTQGTVPAGTAGNSGMAKNLLIMADYSELVSGGSAADCVWGENSGPKSDANPHGTSADYTDGISDVNWENSMNAADLVSKSAADLAKRKSLCAADPKQCDFIQTEIQPTPSTGKYISCVGAVITDVIMLQPPSDCGLLAFDLKNQPKPPDFLPGWIDQGLPVNIVSGDWLLDPNTEIYSGVLSGNVKKFNLQ
ncbi:MAG: hypothetical protein WCP28_05275 [Actinomycetes bacterium]